MSGMNSPRMAKAKGTRPLSEQLYLFRITSSQLDTALQSYSTFSDHSGSPQ